MRVYLRALELDDVKQLVKWRNDLEITSLLGGNTQFVSNYRESEWLKSILLNDKNDLRLAICLTENQLHIGNVNLTSINWVNRTAEFSIFIGEKSFWGKGLASEATRLVLKHGFFELNLNRIYLYVLESNKDAINLYKKVGFVQEGLLRDGVYKNNMLHNLIVMSILKNEYDGKY